MYINYIFKFVSTTALAKILPLLKNLLLTSLLLSCCEDTLSLIMLQKNVKEKCVQVGRKLLELAIFLYAMEDSLMNSSS